MYHQISVLPKDQDALRFVWPKFSTDPIEDYRMSVHIFAKIDSPCIANWGVKKQLETKQSYSERANEFFRTFLHERLFRLVFKLKKSCTSKKLYIKEAIKYMQRNIRNFEKKGIPFN